jgi:hypothetical protein
MLAPRSEHFGQLTPMRTFDPERRAARLAGQFPRQWTGNYQSFAGYAPLSVQLQLDAVTAVGQMVDVRGQITVGGTTLPVQGNLNANSDQLDLLLIGSAPAAGLEEGGSFIGLQGFSLAGWVAPRLTNPGGELLLTPVDGMAAPVIRGLW